MASLIISASLFLFAAMQSYLGHAQSFFVNYKSTNLIEVSNKTICAKIPDFTTTGIQYKVMSLYSEEEGQGYFIIGAKGLDKVTNSKTNGPDIERTFADVNTKTSSTVMPLKRISRDVTEEEFPEPCLQYGYCLTNNGSFPPNCYCDNICVIYGDCCYDFDNSNTTAMSFEQTRNMFKYLSCVDIQSPLNNHDKFSSGFYMVIKCPLEAVNDDGSVDSCVYNNHSDFSVPVVDDDGMVYRNAFCARCHGKNYFRYWSIGFVFNSCPEVDIASFHSNAMERKKEILKNCSIFYTPYAEDSKYVSQLPRSCLMFEQKATAINLTNECVKFANPILLQYDNKTVIAKNYKCLKSKYQNSSISCIDPKTKKSMKYMKSENKNGSKLTTSAIFQFRPIQKNKTLTGNCSKAGAVIMEMDNARVCVEQMVQDFHVKVSVILDTKNTPDVHYFERALTFFYISVPILKLGIRLFKDDLHSNIGEVVCGQNLFDKKTRCCRCSMTLSFLIGKQMTYEEAVMLENIFRKRQFRYNETYVIDKISFNATKRIFNYSQSSCLIYGSKTTDYFELHNKLTDSTVFVNSRNYFEKHFDRLKKMLNLKMEFRPLPTESDMNESSSNVNDGENQTSPYPNDDVEQDSLTFPNNNTEYQSQTNSNSSSKQQNTTNQIYDPDHQFTPNNDYDYQFSTNPVNKLDQTSVDPLSYPDDLNQSPSMDNYIYIYFTAFVITRIFHVRQLVW